MGNKTWKFALIFSFMIFAIAACDDDDDCYYVGNGDAWISYGNLESIDNGTTSKYSIRRDDGSRLIVTEGVQVNSSEAKEGLRIFANYSILGSERDEVNLDGKMNYYIHLYNINEVLCKAPVKQSFILENEEVRNDSIGNDPINVSEAWFGGKYLNVEFVVPVKAGSSVKHFINLVDDDVELHNDSVYITLRHNAYGEKLDVPNTQADQAYEWNSGRVSFDLTSLVPDGQNSVAVKLIWTEYGKNGSELVTREDSGTFTLSGKNNTPKAKSGLYQQDEKRINSRTNGNVCKLK